jgi:hypothetical protein
VFLGPPGLTRSCFAVDQEVGRAGGQTQLGALRGSISPPWIAGARTNAGEICEETPATAVLRWLVEAVPAPAMQGLDGGGERVKDDLEAVVSRFVGGDFVVAAAQVLDEGVPGGERLS